MTAFLRQLQVWRTSEVFGQLIRFGLIGLAVTALYAAIYWPIATFGNRIIHLGDGAVWPLIGVVAAFLSATAVGNVAHSRISFKGHGTRDAGTAQRFFLVQFFGFALNAAFTWLLTGPLVHGPTWWPLIPAVFVTPLVTFMLHRLWVFRAHG